MDNRGNRRYCLIGAWPWLYPSLHTPYLRSWLSPSCWR